jgi:hypothetical protein
VVRRVEDGVTLGRTDATQILPTSLGKLSRLIGMGVDDAAPGEYELTVKIRDEITGATAEARERFVLVRGESGG